MDLNQATITANGIDFAYLEAGVPDGPLALCLHGFPDSAWTWRHLLPRLADAGYRAVAPFMRGYSPTSLAPGHHYQTGALAADAIALHHALGAGPDAVIIGHDWGAMATYGAAAHAPGLWRRVVTAAVPPAGALGAGFFNFDQLKRSWYTFFFQSPLAEMVVGADDLAFIDRLWADWSPGYRANEDLELLKPCLRDPAHLEAAIGYYRAMFDPGLAVPEFAAEQTATGAPTPQPTLYLHGANDGCMGVGVADHSTEFLGAGSRMEIVADSGHFLHVEQPGVVNALILDFLAG